MMRYFLLPDVVMGNVVLCGVVVVIMLLLMMTMMMMMVTRMCVMDGRSVHLSRLFENSRN